MVEEVQEFLPAETGEEVGQPLGFISDKWVKNLEVQIELFKRAKQALLRITDPADWKDLGGGKAYLEDSGVQKVAQAAGVEFGEPILQEMKETDGQGALLRVECRLSGSFRGRTQYDVGEASTRDPFFGTAHGKPVPFESINLGHVKKKAVTNAQHRVLTKILGLGAVSWATLREIGIERPEDRVQYKGQERKAATGSGGWTQAKEKLQGLLLELAGGDPVTASDTLFKLTHKPEKNYRGYREVRELSEKAAQYVLKVVEEEYRRRMEEEFDSGPAGPSSGATNSKPAPREPGEDG